MGNLDVTYTFNQDSLRRFVRGICNWEGNDEVNSDRLRSIGDMELAETLIAAVNGMVQGSTGSKVHVT